MSPLAFGIGKGQGFFRRFRLPPVISIFSYTGSSQTYVVPSGYNDITFHIWGAGGGGNGVYNGQGGCGGYTTGKLNLTAGTSCVIIVGGGGVRGGISGQTAFGGGGTSSVGGDCGGGGLSGIFEGSYTFANSIAIAGGGGGMGGNGSGGLTYYGGCGGGINGEGNISQSCGNSGGGGTQSAGGGGGVPGSQLQGGGGGSRGGSGGGGYYGGGFLEGVSGCGHPGGGGGSGYLHPSKTSNGSFLTLTHTRSAGSVPGSTSEYYIAGVGNGPASTQDGGNGRIVIIAS